MRTVLLFSLLAACAAKAYAAFNCSANVTVSHIWYVDTSLYSVLDVDVTNIGDTKLDVPFAVKLENDNLHNVPSSWNWHISEVTNSTVVGEAADVWQTLEANSANTVNFGLILTSEEYPYIDSLYVADTLCSVKHFFNT
eukprot:jgi/Astpho2/5749/fgenesh1_pg.00080_%23_18_t